MNDNLKFLNEDAPPTAEQEAKLDAKLEQTESLANLVSAVPDEEPSMAWRSSLNEKLVAIQPKPKRKRAWIWGSTAGLVTAGCLAIAIWMPKSGANSPAVGLEAQLLDIHQEEVQNREIAGKGLAAYETQRSTSTVDSTDWSERDLENL